MGNSKLSQPSQAILVILDGLGDRPCPTLGGATPLEAAKTPNMDRLVAKGMCGLVDPLFPGVPVSTHTGTALLLGMPLREAADLKRDPVEAVGAGDPLRRGDVAIRCNFATLQKEQGTMGILDRRAGRIDQGSAQLADLLRDVELGDGVTGNLYPATQHRAVLTLRGGDLSDAITDTDPGSGNISAGVLESSPLDPNDGAAKRAADALNRFTQIAHERLRDASVNRERVAAGRPAANGMISRGAGKRLPLHSLFSEFDLRTAVVAAEGTVLGLAETLGFVAITKPEFTATSETDIGAKVSAAVAALSDHQVVVLHLKAPDVAAHDCLPDEKRDFLESFDRALTPILRQHCVIVVSGDHSTNSNTGRHTGDPVPSLVYSPTGRRDECVIFGEGSCMRGGLGRISATQLCVSMLDALSAMRLFHPQDRELFF